MPIVNLCMITATAGLLFIGKDLAKANGRANDLADCMSSQERDEPKQALAFKVWDLQCKIRDLQCSESLAYFCLHSLYLQLLAHTDSKLELLCTHP